jgi:hypothetical protein
VRDPDHLLKLVLRPFAFGVPSRSSTISGWQTQNGAGIADLVAELIVAAITLYSTCLPSELIVICEVS